MDLLFFGIVFYTLFSVYFLLKNQFQPGVSLFKKSLTVFSLFLVSSIYLLIPFYLFGFFPTSVINTFNLVFIILISMPAGYVLKKYTKLNSSTKSRNSLNFKYIHRVYIYVYIPYLVMFYFSSFKSLYMIMYSILTLIIIYGFIYFMRLIRKSKHGKIYIRTAYLSIIPLVVFLIMLPRISDFDYSSLNRVTRDGVYRTSSIFCDNYSINIVSIDDNTIGGEILDFYLTEEYLYYVVESNNQIIIKVYDYRQDEYVYENSVSVPEENSTYFEYGYRNDFFRISNGSMYFFMFDGIYVFDNLELNMVSELDISRSFQFIQNGELYIFNKVEDGPYEIYEIDETISIVDVVTDTSSSMYVRNNKLVIDENNTITVYGTNTSYEYDAEFDRLVFLSDSAAVFADSEYRFFYQKYQRVNMQNEKDIMYNSKKIHSEVYDEINEMYFFKTNEFLTDDFKLWFIDDDFEKTESYKINFLDIDYDSSTSYRNSISKNIDGEFIYMISNYRYNEDKELYFEINKLVQQDNMLEFPFSGRVSIVSYYLVLLFGIIPSRSIEKDIENQEDKDELEEIKQVE